MKNITVVGGGTAGWFTALLVKEYYPHADITLVESEEIGILGAGEGTTPHFMSLLKEIKISLTEVIREADATIKNGIRFINWNGDGKGYFHSFNPDDNLNQFTNFTVLVAQIKEYQRLVDIDYACKITDFDLVPFTLDKSKINYGQDPFTFFTKSSSFGIHFNARKFAQFLSKVAQNRGITRIEGKITEIYNDEQGNVKSLKIDTQQDVLECDFVFDCSGFARLFLGKHYNIPWQDYSDVLPMNTGLPFFIQHDNNVTPETKSIAMKYGWIWQIPVRDRYGCGYVFDSNYINEDQALEEAEEYFGMKLTVPKVFKFRAGSFTKTLHKNCLAIGLSQSFVEPLEATSLWVAYSNLSDFLNSNGLFVKSEVFQKVYNERCLRKNNDVRDFLYFHYLTKRTDSPFWQEFKNKHNMIPSLSDDLDLINQFSNMKLNNTLFGNGSFMQVGYGLGLIDEKNYENTFDLIEREFARNLRDNSENQQNLVLQTCWSHRAFIDFLSDR